METHWAGPKEAGTEDAGLTVETRRLIAILDMGGPPGSRSATLGLRDGERIVIAKTVNWEVISPITAEPKMVVLRPDKGEYRFLLRSRDQRPFRITRIDSTLPELKSQGQPEAAALTQIVHVEDGRGGAGGDRRGTLTIFTDHPAQGKIEVPIVGFE